MEKALLQSILIASHKRCYKKPYNYKLQFCKLNHDEIIMELTNRKNYIMKDSDKEYIKKLKWNSIILKDILKINLYCCDTNIIKLRNKKFTLRKLIKAIWKLKQTIDTNIEQFYKIKVEKCKNKYKIKICFRKIVFVS